MTRHHPNRPTRTAAVVRAERDREIAQGVEDRLAAVRQPPPDDPTHSADQVQDWEITP